MTECFFINIVNQLQASKNEEEPEDYSKGKYGQLEMIQSTEVNTASFTNIGKICKKLSGNVVRVRGRLHTSRAKGKQCFIVLRQQQYTIQCLLAVDNSSVSKQMVKFASL